MFCCDDFFVVFVEMMGGVVELIFEDLIVGFGEG